MAGWIGPTVALALVVIAGAMTVMTYVMVRAAREAQASTEGLQRAMAEFRDRVDPVLDSISSLTETGTETIELARHEVEELVTTSRMVRSEVEHGLRRARRRLSDFDALVEVMQEEVEETSIDVAAALRTVRASSGVLGRVRRLIGRRRSRDA